MLSQIVRVALGISAICFAQMGYATPQLYNLVYDTKPGTIGEMLFYAMGADGTKKPITIQNPESIDKSLIRTADDYPLPFYAALERVGNVFQFKKMYIPQPNIINHLKFSFKDIARFEIDHDPGDVFELDAGRDFHNLRVDLHQPSITINYYGTLGVLAVNPIPERDRFMTVNRLQYLFENSDLALIDLGERNRICDGKTQLSSSGLAVTTYHFVLNNGTEWKFPSVCFRANSLKQLASYGQYFEKYVAQRIILNGGAK